MSECSNCGSVDHVKKNHHAEGLWSQGQFEFLCRKCRFDAQVERRTVPGHRGYLVAGRVKHGRDTKDWRVYVLASSCGDAIRRAQSKYPELEWDEAYSLQLVRRNV